MIQRRLRVVKWLSTTRAVGAGTLCGREFKAPMSALKRTEDAKSSLQSQFDRHKCEPKKSIQAPARENPDILLRRVPDEDEEDQEEDDAKKKTMMMKAQMTATRSERSG